MSQTEIQEIINKAFTAGQVAAQGSNTAQVVASQPTNIPTLTISTPQKSGKSNEKAAPVSAKVHIANSSTGKVLAYATAGYGIAVEFEGSSKHTQFGSLDTWADRALLAPLVIAAFARK